MLRDLAHGDRPVRMRWRKQIWACGDPDCETKTWTERSWLAGPRRHLTGRAQSEICRRVGEENTSVARYARPSEGWHTALSSSSDALGRSPPTGKREASRLPTYHTSHPFGRELPRNIWPDAADRRDGKSNRQSSGGTNRSLFSGISALPPDPGQSTLLAATPPQQNPEYSLR